MCCAAQTQPNLLRAAAQASLSWARLSDRGGEPVLRVDLSQLLSGSEPCASVFLLAPPWNLGWLPGPLHAGGCLKTRNPSLWSIIHLKVVYSTAQLVLSQSVAYQGLSSLSYSVAYDSYCAVFGILSSIGSHLSLIHESSPEKLGGKAQQQDRYAVPRRLSESRRPLGGGF